MSLTALTAIEIYSNPDDLVFHLYAEEGKYGYTITRGPEQNCKPLIMSRPTFASIELAIAGVKKLLEFICRFYEEEICSSQVSDEIDTEAPVLWKDRRERILEDLRAGDVKTIDYAEQSLLVPA